MLDTLLSMGDTTVLKRNTDSALTAHRSVREGVHNQVNKWEQVL